jgi:hypothetical protein
MSADWIVTVRVRIPDAYEHSEPNAESELRKIIDDEGGIYQVLIGWCDSEKFELVELRPAESENDGR